MLLKELCELIDGQVVCGPDDGTLDVECAFASDLMSDVLTIRHDSFVLITGLANIQTLRTAEMADIRYVLFVRGKQVSPEMAALARENGITLLTTRYSMFKTSGLLYRAGLKPVY